VLFVEIEPVLGLFIPKFLFPISTFFIPNGLIPTECFS